MITRICTICGKKFMCNGDDCKTDENTCGECSECWLKLNGSIDDECYKDCYGGCDGEKVVLT